MRWLMAAAIAVSGAPHASCATSKHVSVRVVGQAPSFSFTYGVDHGPACDTGVDLTRELQSFGSTLIRTHDSGVLDWPVIFPHPDLDVDTRDPANYNFGPGDEYFRRIVASGFQPYFRLGTSWGQMGGGLPPAGVPYNRTALIDVMVHTVMHYNDGWAGGFAGKPVQYWEIWCVRPQDYMARPAGTLELPMSPLTLFP